MIARPYQKKAIEATLDVLEDKQSALIVMATGLGKTIIFTNIINHFSGLGRTMIIAHREELITQAAKHVENITGEIADVEMADQYATLHDIFKSKVVVSTVQTQNAGRDGGRMTRFEPNEFALLIIDEAHHATAKSYRKLIDHYKLNETIKILGVTATPDRTDEEALGQIFDEVAYEYDIRNGIDNGWLVPINQQMITIDGLDYSRIRTTAGDLNGKDLAEVLEYESNLHAIASPTMELTGDKKTLIFAASVAQAERLTEIINRHKYDSARFVCGKTPKDLRRTMLKDYKDNRFQYLVNVGVATEGFDMPDINCIIMARPTKSRCLYAQMSGRGCRPLPGLVDGTDTFDERKELIANSDKPYIDIIDFVGNCGRHKLITTADILGGNYTDDIIEQAKKNAKKKGSVDMISELAIAEKQISEKYRKAEEAAIRGKVMVRAMYSTAKVNPFDVLDLTPWRERAWHKGRQPTMKQTAFLEKCGVDCSGLSFTHASQIIDKVIKRRKAGTCTYRQANLLRRFKYKPDDITFERASELITTLKNNNWKRPHWNPKN
jgi:superfamily II DNA or RNA helicase